MKMKILIFFILATSLQFTFAQSKDSNIHASSTVGSQSRYEVIQSTLAARWTFRLDKVCGNIGQLVSTNNDGITWESMRVIGLPKCSADGKNRYQLFLSGIAARHTYLLNTENGKTWQIRTLKDNQGLESTAWHLFDE
jgi:hypothetical protein